MERCFNIRYEFDKAVVQERIAQKVTDNINGVFINIKNTKDIVDAIKRLTADKDFCTTLSCKAKEAIIAKFDDRKYINKLNELYSK